MKSFKDADGKSWQVAVDAHAIKRGRDLVGFDLLSVADDPANFTRLGSDPVLLSDVLYAVCKPDVEAAGLKDEQFGRLLAGRDGGVLDDASDALQDALIDFFPKHRREPLRQAVKKLRKMTERASEMAVAKLNSPETERMMEGILQRAANFLPSDAGG